MMGDVPCKSLSRPILHIFCPHFPFCLCLVPSLSLPLLILFLGVLELDLVFLLAALSFMK